MAYAVRTKVAPEQTRNEIEQLLRKYGADLFSYIIDDKRGVAAIMFRASNRHVKFKMVLPDKKQALMSRWRSLLLCVKAKLESVDAEIETFEQAFMAHVVLPDGQTMSEWVSPQLLAAYKSGNMPEPMLALPAPKSAS